MSEAVKTDRDGGGPYASLRAVLDEAYAQSAHGKGKARHANDRPFEQQPILEIGRMVGPSFALGQVMKKAQEARGMLERDEVDAASAELLGAIVYAASVVVLAREGNEGRRLGGNAAAELKDGTVMGRLAELGLLADPIPAPVVPEVSPSVQEREPKTGDIIAWRGCFGASMYTRGSTYTIMSGPRPDGLYGVTDDEQGTGAHTWDAEGIKKHFELIRPAPDMD